MRNDPTFLDKFANPYLLFLYLVVVFGINLICIFGFILIKRLPVHLYMQTQKNMFKRFISHVGYFLHRYFFFFQIGFIIIYFIIFGLYFLVPAKVIFPINPAFGKKNVDENHPLHITFDRPINFEKLKISIKPDVPGKWLAKSTKALPWLKNDLFFYPDSTLASDAEFSATLNSVKGIYFNINSKNYLFNFRTPPPPDVNSISVKDGSENIDINIKFGVKLSYDDRFRNEWSAQLIPELTVETILSKDGKAIEIRPTKALQKGVDYQLGLYRTPINYNFTKKKITTRGEIVEVKKITFKTVLSPTVKSTNPSGSGALINSPIKIEFRQDMDRQSVEDSWGITPKTDGKISWQSDTIFSFQPTSDLTKNTKYDITIKKTAMTKYKTAFENDYIFSFTTIGYVIPSFSPGNSAGNIAINKTLIITFNQAVDHTSAEKAFSIDPTIAGGFSWKGNALTFTPSTNYENSKGYTINIASGVKSISGLDSNQIFSSRFTTIDQVVKLDIPFYKQEHYYTCGIAAARMAMAYKGVKMSELAILDEVGYDSTPLSSDGSVWGNPNAGFVGTLMGQPKGTGYGVHWGPVAKAINNHLPAEVKSGWNVQGIATEIAAGNPVIIFWVNGIWPSYERSWKTTDGTSVRAVNGMHAVVVNGFSGTVSNPKSFTVTDPWWPRKSYDVSLFNSYWKWFGNTAIVVR